jgi:MYXO-CTERM domain-containing protein
MHTPGLRFLALVATLALPARALAASPTVTTSPATSVTATSAVLNGSINPNGEATTGWFRQHTSSPGTCNDTFGTRVPGSGGTSVGSGTSATAYSVSTSGLLPGTTYYYCAIAENASGKVFGSIVTFTTPALAPTVATTAATSVTSTSAVLNGSANPNGSATTGFFRYSTSNPGTCNNTFGIRVPAGSGGTSLGAGNAAVSYTETITGLSPGVTYYACAIATNSVGTGVGNVLSFTTLVAAPTVTTHPVGSITGTSATFSGSANPNGAATTGWFRYSASDPGGCNDAFGTRVPTAGISLGSGTTAQTYSQSVSGLSNGTTYYVCAIAQNSVGTSFGAQVTFTTPAAPTVTTLPASSVAATSAVLNGSAIPNGATATGYFRYATSDPGLCSDSFGQRLPSTTGSGTNLGSGSSAVSYSQTATGLLPGTTYYYCALAYNSVGTSTGTLLTFTTPAQAPTVTTSSVTLLTGTSATLNGSANPRGAETTGYFRYSTVSPGSCNDTFGTRAPQSGGSALGSGNSTVSFNQAIAGLTTGTTYYYCAIATNSVGTGVGSVLSFTTPSAPTVTTKGPTSLSTGTQATLNGHVNANGASATAWFRYATTHPGSCHDGFGTRAPGTGGTTTSGAVDYAQTVIGTPGATYYYCAIASNSVGMGFGAVFSYTLPAAPQVTTNAASPVNATSATMNGTATPNGASTTGWFRYSTSNPGACADNFGTRIPSTGGTSLGSGSNPVNWSLNTGTLLPGTIYYYCALASNSVGTSFGQLESFTTPATAPIVTTSAASAVGGTTATLNGSANPRGAATTGWYRYSTTSPGSCDDVFGTRAPATGGTPLGSGNTAVSFPEAVSGLTPGTTYYFCAIAENQVGKSFGSVFSFATPDQPTVTTVSATASSTGTSATLSGSVNPNGATATAYFRFDTTHPGTCNDTFGSRAPATGGTTLSGTTTQSYSQVASGLSTGTTYYYCAAATNSVGTSFGAVLSFTTPAAPTVTTLAATGVGASTATLNATATPNRASATGWFRYWSSNPGSCTDTGGTRAPSTGGTALGAGTSPVAYSVTPTGLLPGVTYYFCALASNSVGTSTGALLSFTTPAQAPSVVTSTTTGVTSSSADLNASVNANGAATVAWFRYSTTSPGSCNDTFGLRAPNSGGTSVPAGNTNTAVSQAISGLSLATTYYYCAIAENSVGKTLGNLLSFTTSAAPPTVTTLAASSVTTTSATLNASANPNGATTTGWFRFHTSSPGSCNDTFGTRAPASGGTALGGGTSPVSYSVNPTTLSPGVTYYFCAIAENTAGKSYGAVLSFTTTATPPTVSTLAATAISGTTADLNGTANPNGAATTAWFRFATASPGSCNDTFGTRAPQSGGTSLGATPGNQAFSQSLSGLTPGATYYFCAIAENAMGKVFGSVLSFSTPAGPAVTTGVASPVTATSATLNATANPNGASATGWFRYSDVSPGTCNDTFGTRAPATGGQSLGSGTSAVAYQQAISGLSPGTTYHYCAIAQNLVGTSFGALLSFTTPPTAPLVVTSAATDLTGTTATLNGQANPNGAATTGWFRYSTVNPGSCNDSFGTRAPASGGTAIGSGSTAVAWAQPVSGLSPSTTYYFCALATNSVGTTFGGMLSFTTPNVPLVTTGAASGVTATGATLNGSANPRGDEATGYFRYGTVNPGTCNDTFGTRAPQSGGTSLGSGNSAVSFSQPITGLASGTTYYVCALAVNVVGTGVGTVQSFTTPTAPSVVTNPPSALGSTTATLSGSANPNGAATTGWFRYAQVNPGTCNDSFGTRAPSSGGTSLGSGSSLVGYTQAISGLTSGTTYYYCAIASNQAGVSVGAVESFTTTAAPVVTTEPASGITSTAATLNGTANPNGAATTGWFRFATSSPGSCNDTFGVRAPSSGGIALGAGSSAAPYAQAISGLSAGTTYYYCAIAQNAVGLRFGQVVSFTAPAAPTVTTSATTLVTSDSATLNGSANPRGSATSGWFRYSTTSPGSCNDTFGIRAPASGGTSLGSGTAAVSYSQPLTGLTPGATYYACAIAQNAVGTGLGALVSFTTPAAPTVTTGSASSIGASSATLSGSANPRGSATTGYFRYGTSNPGTCDDTFGTRYPASGGTSLGSGQLAVSYSQSVPGLASGTTYYFCAVATNAVGTSFGAVTSFSTLQGPLVTTLAVTSLGSSSATLNGSANPNGLSSTGWFRYSATHPGTCSDTFGTRAPSTGGTALGSGSSAVSYSQAISGLSAGVTYYYCALASNSVGTSVGALLSFTTLAAPSVTTVAASGITSSGATFNGTANPNGASATGFFRYSTTSPGSCTTSFGTRFPATGGVALGAGTSAVPFDQTVSTLLPGTTYYYCAQATNSVGTGLGTLMSFTTPASPTVTTSAATGITSSTATLNGSANPRGAPAEGWFRYGTVSPGACNDTFGTRAPQSGGTALGSGTAAVNYSQAVSGLSAGTTYYFCAIASNPSGTSFGALLTFTTPGAPTVTTTAASGVSGSSATLNGSAAGNGAATTAWFRYSPTSPGACNDTFGTRAPSTGGTAVGSGGATPYAQPVSGLSPGTTYFFCAIAQNSVGTTVGNLLSFTTPAAPTANSLAATSVSSSSATLNGSGNPNGAATTGWFRYSATNPGTCSDTFGTRAPATGGSALGSGTSTTSFSQPASSLNPGTTYFFCAITQNSVGTSLGSVLSFTTPAASPTVNTLAATAIGGGNATLNGSANPNGAATTGWFRYALAHPGSCNDTFGIRAPQSGGTAVGSGNTATGFNQSLSSLQPGTTYYFCALAQNSAGTASGAVLSFTTPAAPAVTTTAATGVGSSGATLNGTGTPNGAATTGWFRYATTHPGSCNDVFGTRAPQSGGTSLGAANSPVPFSQPVSGLTPGATYYVCAVAQNAVGTSFGTVQTFTTQAAPAVTTGPATQVTSLSAQLNGSAVPNGAPTTGWFRFATTAPAACNDTFGTRTPASGGTPLGSGTTSTPFVQGLVDLSPGVTYYYCAIAQNAAGTSFGEVVAFQPEAPAPTVTTETATDVGTRAATLHARANPNRSETTGWFRYDTVDPGSCNDTFGTRVSAAGFPLGAGAADVSYSVALEGLKPSVTYYYCAVAGNLGGAGFGALLTFTTGAEPPSAKTMPAQVMGDGSVTLNGLGNPNGQPGTGWFRYDTTDPVLCNFSFGQQAPMTGLDVGRGHEDLPYTETVRGLAPGRYYYCAIVSTASGTSYGVVESFQVGDGAPPAGCGCSAGEGGTGTWALLLGLGALGLAGWRRRRRASGPCTG